MSRDEVVGDSKHSADTDCLNDAIFGSELASLRSVTKDRRPKKDNRENTRQGLFKPSTG